MKVETCLCPLVTSAISFQANCLKTVVFIHACASKLDVRMTQMACAASRSWMELHAIVASRIVHYGSLRLKRRSIGNITGRRIRPLMITGGNAGRKLATSRVANILLDEIDGGRSYKLAAHSSLPQSR